MFGVGVEGTRRASLVPPEAVAPSPYVNNTKPRAEQRKQWQKGGVEMWMVVQELQEMEEGGE